MVVSQLDTIIASQPIGCLRTTLVVSIMACTHRCAHFVRHVPRSADSVGELKAVHPHQEIGTGQIGYQVYPDGSLQVSSNAALRWSGSAETLRNRTGVSMKKTDVMYSRA